MLRGAPMGAATGAVDTALNVTTYAGAAIRGRATGSVPAEVAGKLAGKAGSDISGEGSDEQTVQNRKNGFGAPSGYVVGLVVGIAYGLIAPHLGGVPKPVAGAWLGLGAIGGSGVPAAASGVADPTKWGLSSCVSNLGPHVAYGLATVVAYDSFTGA